MQLVAPDILSDACGLSVGLVITGMILGLALWLLGWRCHRFWIVLIATVLAGIYGLYDAALFRAQPLVAALLLAFAGGLLALALVRLLAFLAGGLVGLLAAQSMLPSCDPAICFLLAGLVSLFLFRVSVMAITSLAGATLLGYGTLSLLDHYTNLDTVSWSGKATVLINWICGLFAVSGFGLQYFFDRRRLRRAAADGKKEVSSWDILLGGGVKWGFGKKAKKAG
jgi:hypothetical protein